MTNQITPGRQSETSDGHCGQSVEVILLGCLFEIRLGHVPSLPRIFLSYSFLLSSFGKYDLTDEGVVNTSESENRTGKWLFRP